MQARATLGMGFQGVTHGFVVAAGAALGGGMSDRAMEMLAQLDSLPPAQVTPHGPSAKGAEGRRHLSPPGTRAAR